MADSISGVSMTDSTALRPELSPNPGRRGVLNPQQVRLLAFLMIALSIFVCAFVCLLAVWDYADRDTAWKALSSLGIVAGAMSSFVFVNEIFGRTKD